eukprot:CAMPEP_0202448492 /NCGR_PEP_ID=MMETSP1360-20130828/7304_1 /ASSEMBLY_ACC=CAM_ASM_000848 /TAXON_ID=515479 /ORGANISM="Licmophora paradoxa, Strain CCMP2313" /LENGTH=264 /DNA_ID=CAMNT_0049066091 /DNA_START=325 /DNA_END=1119 /DNA_ORIENTATION=+
MDKAQRKRERERQRRNEVNQGFDDLLALLVSIDPAIRKEVSRREEAKHFHEGKKGNPDTDTQLVNRVEVMAKTSEVLMRLHHENEERKALVEKLQVELHETRERVRAEPHQEPNFTKFEELLSEQAKLCPAFLCQQNDLIRAARLTPSKMATLLHDHNGLNFVPKATSGALLPPQMADIHLLKRQLIRQEDDIRQKRAAATTGNRTPAPNLPPNDFSETGFQTSLLGISHDLDIPLMLEMTKKRMRRDYQAMSNKQRKTIDKFF